MPEISHFYGIIIYMFPQEHNPPHFHVKYNEFKASIDIKTGTITGTLPRRALNLVYSWLDEHRDELLENWERLAKGERAQTIKPLD